MNCIMGGKVFELGVFTRLFFVRVVFYRKLLLAGG